MTNFEWAAYVAMALVYACAFCWSIIPTAKTKTVKFILVVISVIVGATWIVTMPMMAFYTLISAGQRTRS